MSIMYLVYQDCPLCGSRKIWGEKQLAKAETNGYEVQKVSFATSLGRQLIKEAVFKYKIGTLPFFTDGKKFALTVDEIVGTKKKGKKHGDSSKG